MRNLKFDPLFGFSDTIILKAAQESFEYVANFYRAAYGLKALYNIENFYELEAIEIVANAVHDGWSYTVYNMDAERKENWIRVANIPYCLLDKSEKEKNRVIARKLIEFIRLTKEN